MVNRTLIPFTLFGLHTLIKYLYLEANVRLVSSDGKRVRGRITPRHGSTDQRTCRWRLKGWECLLIIHRKL